MAMNKLELKTGKKGSAVLQHYNKRREDKEVRSRQK